MCGIAGIIGNLQNPKERILKMLDMQKHRGPDALNIWSNDNIFLGHNRLSIIDLHESSNQPMHSSDDNYVIVFNGEIYNYIELKSQLSDYTFKTNSDTEVILAMYSKFGSKMLEKLNGMFSFAIWDKKNQTLFAARDPFGVKPFYYSFLDNTLFFSSEIKTLWTAEVPKKRNLKVWANYFKYGTYGLPNETFWEGIHQLPSGHFLMYEPQKLHVKIERWYHFVERIQLKPKISVDELKEEYSYLLKKSVRLRFRADVPIGFNISGGLDSSTLLSLVHDLYPENKTIEAFTFYSNDDRYDELHWVKKMIEKTGKHLNSCLLDIKEVPELIEKVSYFQDEPFGGFPTLAYSNIFKCAQKKGVKVLLDGQGMDEAWAGYDYYLKKTDFLVQGVISSPVRPEVFNDDFLSYAEKDIYPTPFENTLQNMQFRDLFYTKIPRALRFNDRISMMYSTELREPFLDFHLVELAFAQDESVKIQNGKSKWLLRELVKNKLGSSIAFAPKRPVQTPQREWISNGLKEYFEVQIKIFSEQDFVNKTIVKKLWEEYLEGNQDNSFFIWQWLSF